MHTPLLSCADPLRPTHTDPHFAAEPRAARALGAETALIDHDALLAGDARAAVRRVPRGFGAAWYRGWMIPTARYGELAAALADRDAGLIVSPTAYRRAHELPGWYPGVRGSHARECLGRRRARRAAARAGRGDRQGLREVPQARLERFASPETRVWWLDGQPIFTGPHPDIPDATVEPDLSGIDDLVVKLDCRFVTTDVVRRADGAWRVVEVGDGQVSDRPAMLDPEVLVGALTARKVQPSGRFPTAGGGRAGED